MSFLKEIITITSEMDLENISEKTTIHSKEVNEFLVDFLVDLKELLNPSNLVPNKKQRINRFVEHLKILLSRQEELEDMLKKLSKNPRKAFEDLSSTLSQTRERLTKMSNLVELSKYAIIQMREALLENNRDKAIIILKNVKNLKETCDHKALVEYVNEMIRNCTVELHCRLDKIVTNFRRNFTSRMWYAMLIFWDDQIMLGALRNSYELDGVNSKILNDFAAYAWDLLLNRKSSNNEQPSLDSIQEAFKVFKNVPLDDKTTLYDFLGDYYIPRWKKLNKLCDKSIAQYLYNHLYRKKTNKTARAAKCKELYDKLIPTLSATNLNEEMVMNFLNCLEEAITKNVIEENIEATEGRLWLNTIISILGVYELLCSTKLKDCNVKSELIDQYCKNCSIIANVLNSWEIKYADRIVRNAKVPALIFSAKGADIKDSALALSAKYQ